MKNNQKTIEEIREKFNKYLSEIENQNLKEEFLIQDLEIVGQTMYYNGVELSKSAQKKIFDILRVKPSFVEYSTKMSPDEWDKFAKKLKQLRGGIKLIGQYNSSGEIQNVFVKNVNKKQKDDHNLEFYVNQICESLENSKKQYILDGINFEDNYVFDINLLDIESDIDIFGNAKDIWKGGTSFIFNPVSFQTTPYFSRLICSNGMRTKKEAFTSNIQQTKFNTNKIAKKIRDSILNNKKELNKTIIERANYLIKHNVSLLEFYNFRNIFTRDKENETLLNIARKYFDDKIFYKVYGENIKEKSRKWLSTADSGINAYKFFNLITWIASHRDKTNIESNFARNLQIEASEFFLSKKLDLVDVAKPINIKYPELVEMQ